MQWRKFLFLLDIKSFLLISFILSDLKLAVLRLNFWFFNFFHLCLDMELDIFYVTILFKLAV